MVEFAVVLPLVVLLLLGALEISQGIMVQHTLQETAQAAARVYAIGDTSQQDVDKVIEKAMSQARIQTYEVVYDPPTKAAIRTHMEPVTVSVRVNFASVAWLPASFLGGSQLSASAVMPADLNVEP